MRCQPGLIVIALLGATAQAAAQSSKIQAEITRLVTEMPAVIPESSRGAIATRMERALKALKDQHVYLALYDLQVVFEAEGGYRLASTEKSVAGHEAFTRTWTAMGAPPPGVIRPTSSAVRGRPQAHDRNASEG